MVKSYSVLIFRLKQYMPVQIENNLMRGVTTIDLDQHAHSPRECFYSMYYVNTKATKTDWTLQMCRLSSVLMALCHVVSLLVL